MSRLYREAVSLAPESATVAVMAGAFLQSQDQMHEAQRMFEKVREEEAGGRHERLYGTIMHCVRWRLCITSCWHRPAVCDGCGGVCGVRRWLWSRTRPLPITSSESACTA